MDTHPEVLPFECHEHHYGLMNLLSVARAGNKAAERGAEHKKP